LLCTVVCVLHLRVIVGRVDLISIRSSINVATLVFIVAVVTFIFAAVFRDIGVRIPPHSFRYGYPSVTLLVTLTLTITSVTC